MRNVYHWLLQASLLWAFVLLVTSQAQDVEAQETGINSTRISSKAMSTAASLMKASELLDSMLQEFKLPPEALPSMQAAGSAPETTQCYFDQHKNLCAFNTLWVGSVGFPEPQNPAETLFKEVAIESYECAKRTSAGAGSCEEDRRCIYRMGQCVVGREMVQTLNGFLHHCTDSLYSPRASVCFRTTEPSETVCSQRPDCKYEPAGPGIPQPVCLPKFVHNATQAYEALVAKHQHDTVPHKAGFGTCHAAKLQFTANSECLFTITEECHADPRCEWFEQDPRTGRGFCTLKMGEIHEKYFHAESPFIKGFDMARAVCMDIKKSHECNHFGKESSPPPARH